MIHIRWMASLILNIVLGGCQNQKSYVWLDSPINKEWVDRTIASMNARPDLDVFISAQAAVIPNKAFGSEDT